MAVDLPHTFSYTQARRAGMSKEELYRLKDSGDLELIARGLYRRSDAPLADHDLVVVAKKAPRATLCLVSALAHHDLTDALPGEHHIALPRGSWRPRTDAPVWWHDFAPATFDVGRERLTLDGETQIGLYGAARSIIDAFRLKGQVGPEVAYEALRRWLRQGGQPGQLLRTANGFPRAVSSLRQAIEVLQ